MANIEHPNVVDAKRELEWSGGEWKHVWIVRTDLSLDMTAEDYDSAAVQSLIDAVNNAIRQATRGFHKIRIQEV